MLDMKILIISTFFSLLILVIISSFFWYKFPLKKYPKYFTLFSVLFLFGQVLTSSRNFIPDIFSIVTGNTLLVAGYVFLYVGIRDLLNLEAPWHNRYLMPIGVVLFGFILFTFIYYSVDMRIVIISIFFAMYSFVISLMFWKNSTKKFKFIDDISAILFFMGVILFSIRIFRASTVYLPANYLSTTDLMITLVYVYLFFMTIWLSVILIMRAITLFLDKNNINLQ